MAHRRQWPRAGWLARGGLLSLVGVLTLTGCAQSTSQPSADTRTAEAIPSVFAAPATATTVVGGLTSPWGLVSLPDGTTLVSERDTGKILRVSQGAATVLTQLTEVHPGGEGGLLGLALSPDRQQLFAYLTAADDNRILAMSWDGARLGEPRAILTGIPKGTIHDGGRLLVGPDGYLYVGTGETGNRDLAQDRSSLGGKILRVTLDGKPAPGNPFGNEVYSYGHRNVQGLAFDDAHRLWASEFGEQTWDELNLITPGANYGWPKAEGSSTLSGMTNPKVVWKTSEASPSGLAYWQGELWMAALRGGRLWEIPLRDATPGAPLGHFTGDYGRLRSVTVAADGHSLLLSNSNTDGRGVPQRNDDRVIRVTG